MGDRPKKRRRRETVDRGKYYVYGAFGGIALAIFGTWMTPLATSIGRRGVDLVYMLGYASLSIGCALALICVLLIVIEY